MFGRKVSASRKALSASSSRPCALKTEPRFPYAETKGKKKISSHSQNFANASIQKLKYSAKSFSVLYNLRRFEKGSWKKI